MFQFDVLIIVFLNALVPSLLFGNMVFTDYNNCNDEK